MVLKRLLLAWITVLVSWFLQLKLLLGFGDVIFSFRGTCLVGDPNLSSRVLGLAVPLYGDWFRIDAGLLANKAALTDLRVGV